jgi:hypothetical protein
LKDSAEADEKEFMNNRIIILGILSLTTICHASDFATTLVYAAGTFGPYPYNDPCSVLGEPTNEVDDPSYFNPFPCSLVYGAWNVTPWPDEKPVITTIGSDGVIVVGFDHRVLDDPDNPYGMDFIVFGNIAFSHNSQQYLAPTTDMDLVYLPSSPGYVGLGKVKIQVAQYPNGPWFGFSKGLFADSQFPTNPFAWDSVNKKWGSALDSLKPVNPALKTSDFSNLTVPQAIALYEGSAGGTGYDLQCLNPQDYQQLSIDPLTGRRWIRYIRLTSGGSPAGQVDAISDVAPMDVPVFPRGDLNYDYRVNLQDLMILAQNWTVCTWMCE